MSRLPIFAVAFIYLVSASGSPLAHSSATGIVKERMSLMSDVADQMKIVGKIVKGEQAYDANLVKSAAQTISTHAEGIPEMFPEGSNQHPSEALVEIWNDWDEFVRLTTELKNAADALSSSAADATEAMTIRPQFIALGKTCSECHEIFRKAQ